MRVANERELLEVLNSPFASADFLEVALEVLEVDDIGETLSRALMRTREALGGFASLAEVEAVRGIGPLRLARMLAACAEWLGRREAAAASGERADPDLPSVPFDLAPPQSRAAAHAHMAQHLVPPLQAGAEERALRPDAAGRLAIPAGARLPLIVAAPRRALAVGESWRVTSTVRAPGPAVAAALEAVAAYRRAAAATAAGADVTALSLQVSSLAALLWAPGRKAEAILAAQAAVEMLRVVQGADDALIKGRFAAALHNLCSFLIEASRLGEGARAATDTIAAYRRAAAAPGADASAIAGQLRALATLLRGAGLAAEAAAAAAAAQDLG